MTTTTTTSSPCLAACRPRLQDWFTATEAASADDAKNWDRILLLDGGVSTHLASVQENNDSGHEAVGAFAYKELWSSSLLLTEAGRQTILQGHLDWLHAGSNLISTVTYQCHYLKEKWPVVIANEASMNVLWKHGIQLASDAMILGHEQQHASILSSSSDSSNSSKRKRRPTFLIASSGCYGAALANGAEYTGDYGPNVTIQDLMNFHRRKLQQIIMAPVASASCDSINDSGGSDVIVDCIAIETVPSLAEVKALVQLLSEPEMIKMFKINRVACWISLACGNGECLYDKTPLIQALQVLNALPVDILPAIGLNCCDFRHLSSLTNILVTFIAQNQNHQDHSGAGPTNTRTTTRAMVLYPNSGEEWDAVAKVFKPKRTTTTTITTTEYPIVDCLTRVIEAVETTWRRETTKSSISTPPPPPPYPRIIVGGCCRTTPTEIAALRVAIDKHLEKEKKTRIHRMKDTTLVEQDDS